MACDQIVAENLTLTGSIGVVTAKFNAEKLNEKIGKRLQIEILAYIPLTCFCALTRS
jgi:ClpP class serine protease